MKTRLRNGMELFVGLFESAPDAIVVTNGGGVIVQANARAEATFGYTRQELLGQNLEMVLPPSIRAKHMSRRASYLAQPKTRPMGSGMDLSAQRKDGSLIPVDISLSPCPLNGETLVISIIRDITERKRMEEQLKENEEKYRELFENEIDAVLIVDAETGRFEDVNRAALALFGYSKEEFLGLKVANISGEKDKTQPTFEQRAKNDPNLHRIVERSLVKKDGTVFYGEVSLGVFFSGGRKKTIGAIRDITERRESEVKLKRYVRQLRALTNQMVRVKEEEARRIARELHDEAGQLLAAVHIGLQSLLREMPMEYREAVTEITQHLTLVEERLRSVAHELRPVTLDQIGLLAAIESLARPIASRHRFTVSVQGPRETRLPPAVETALYRIVQESLNNVGKHAGASSVQIRIEKDKGTIRCSIDDDGVGFDVARLWSPTESGGIGLIGIRERLQEFGGSLQINSTPGGGTQLLAIIPEIQRQTGQT